MKDDTDENLETRIPKKLAELSTKIDQPRFKPVGDTIRFRDIRDNIKNIPELEILLGIGRKYMQGAGWSSSFSSYVMVREGKITYLKIEGNFNLTMVPPELAALSSLQGVDIVLPQLSDIQGLSGLGHIRNLRIYALNVNDLGPLIGLTQLTDLDLMADKQDISVLERLPNLAYLSLFYQSPTMPNLYLLRNLRSVFIYDELLSDLRVLEGLPYLWGLNVESSKVSDLTPLLTLPELTVLDLTFTQVRDLWGLRYLGNLRELSLGYNHLTNIERLKGLVQLEELELHNNQIRDIGPLAHLPNLTDLALEENPIEDISPLAKLHNLNYLSITKRKYAKGALKEIRRQNKKVQIEYYSLDGHRIR